MIPLQRFASAKEMARYLTHIASKDFDYMTGQTITVDGGFVIAANQNIKDLK